MDLMLVEPDATGHRLILYVRSIAREASNRGWRLRLMTTATARKHRAFGIVVREFGDALTIHEMPDVSYARIRPRPLELVRLQASLYASMKAGFRAARESTSPDIVYLNSMDPVAKLIAVRGSPFGGQAFAGMLMSPRFHHRAEGVNTPPHWSDPLNRAVFRRLLRMPSLRAVATVDATLPMAAAREQSSGYEKVFSLPDPGTLRSARTRMESRASLGIAADAFVVLVYGGLAERKGLSRVLDALENPALTDKVVALFAGHRDDSASRLLSTERAARLRAAGRLFELNGFLDDDDEARAFRAADAVWVAYDGFYGSSGVLVQGVAAGLPVIAGGEGLIEWLTRRHGLGVVIEAGADAVPALARLVRDRAFYESCATRGLAFARERSPERFGAAVCDLLAFSAGRAARE